MHPPFIQHSPTKRTECAVLLGLAFIKAMNTGNDERVYELYRIARRYDMLAIMRSLGLDVSLQRDLTINIARTTMMASQFKPENVLGFLSLARGFDDDDESKLGACYSIDSEIANEDEVPLEAFIQLILSRPTKRVENALLLGRALVAAREKGDFARLTKLYRIAETYDLISEMRLLGLDLRVSPDGTEVIWKRSLMFE